MKPWGSLWEAGDRKGVFSEPQRSKIKPHSSPSEVFVHPGVPQGGSKRSGLATARVVLGLGNSDVCDVFIDISWGFKAYELFCENVSPERIFYPTDCYSSYLCNPSPHARQVNVIHRGGLPIDFH